MALSWNEIKDRALKFSKEWENEVSEDAEAKSFWDDLFNVFGISRRRVATFETKVTKEDRKDGYIDLLWKGNLLVEHKSAGKDLDRAYKQAIDYFPGLKEHELPKYILVCNFQKFKLYNLEDNTELPIEFELKDLVDNVHHFGFIAGYQKRAFKEHDPVNIKAAELMGKLHDKLKAIGYEGHPLELYLVRLLFCLFADDTTIFEKDIFFDFIDQRTSEDGSDLAARLSELFYILNAPMDKRLKNIDEQLNRFPYVNGKLFEETLPPASFDSGMREILLNCCALDWGKISPAIFGSMFQSVMNPQERRNLGAHYTSETNILKLIKPLFLDELWAEFESIKTNKNKLTEFHTKLSSLRFLDPACGCGNFLVITYRELRLLEIEVLRALLKSGQRYLNVSDVIQLDVDMMAGIEYKEFPARIAEVAMWLIDHQMNLAVSQAFGQYFVRLPLKKAAKIVNADALETDWSSIIQKKDLSYILGNPPFIGSKFMKREQRDSIEKQFENADGSGILDYVTGWYMKAANYIQGTSIKVAFVSTCSIVQGEQTSVLWGQLINRFNIKIHFAHRTFNWSNEARGNAAVHVVIIGFANFDTTKKRLFEYEDIKGEPHEIAVKNINPYLVDAKDILITKNSNPICKVPKIKFGNQPIDGGHLLLNETEKTEALIKEPFISKFIRKYVGSVEFINNIPRYCLWLKNADPIDLRNSKIITDRLQRTREFRISSVRKDTRKLADNPSLFAFVSHNETEYIIIPSVSSERRKYIPIGFMPSNVIASNLCLIIPDAKIYHFGVLTSEMHMAWVKYVCGRLKSDYRYSNSIVYNNFPWPEDPSEKQIEVIKKAAQKVLDARMQFPNCSLADLYDPLTMPAVLIKAHQELDKAVDLSYRPQAFPNDAKRMEFLFDLYEKYTGSLFSKKKLRKK